MQSLEAISDETLEKTAYSHYVCEQREDTAVEHQRANRAKAHGKTAGERNGR